MAAVSFAVSTIGLVIPFCLIDPLVSGSEGGVPISNAIQITSATWVAHDGRQRPLTLSQPISALFTYQLTAADSRTPHIEEGYVEVRFAEKTFKTGTFAVNCFQSF
jgi:hypothetical protein